MTRKDIEKGSNTDRLFRETVEEVGELATALTVEGGGKPHKFLTESAKVEAADVVICALGVFYALGGTAEDLVRIGHEKLDKWESVQ